MSGQSRLQIIPLDDPDDITCMTFVLTDEDHTLGNALRYIIMKKYTMCTKHLNNVSYPDVTFCGYSVPHPSEQKINLRIQTNGIPATEALMKGLQDLNDLCGHVLGTFEESVSQFKEEERLQSMTSSQEEQV